MKNGSRGLTIHLAFIGEDDLATATGWVDSKRLLEALLDVRAPHTLGVIVHGLLGRVAHPLHVLGRTFAAAPAAGINCGGWDLQAEAWSTLGRDLVENENKRGGQRCSRCVQYLKYTNNKTS